MGSVLEIGTEAARKHWLTDQALPGQAVRFHHVSTDEVYGTLAPTDPAFTEETPYDPRSPYSASKAASDHLVRSYFHTYGLPVSLTNCSNNYGPFQFPEKLIPVMIANAVNGKPLPIYGDGMQTRSFCYVDDLVRGLMAMMDGPDDFVGPVNLGNPNEMTIRELAETVIAMTGSNSQLHFQELPQDDPLQRRPDIALAKDRLGWEPRIDLETGLKATIEHFRNLDQGEFRPPTPNIILNTRRAAVDA